MSTTDRIKEILGGYCEGLKAAGSILDEFVLIPKYELPDFKVIDRNGKPHVDCGSDWGTWDVAHVDRMRTAALEYVGAWLTAEKWHAEQADAIAIRRNELADEFYGYSYAVVTNAAQGLINRIIELERRPS